MVSKNKSSNPLDSHRKAVRQRELKRNKEKRDRVREARREEIESRKQTNSRRDGHDYHGETSSKIPSAKGGLGDLPSRDEDGRLDDVSGDDEDDEDGEIVMPPDNLTRENSEDDDAASDTSEDSDGIVLPAGSPPAFPSLSHADRVWPPLPPGPIPPENFVRPQSWKMQQNARPPLAPASFQQRPPRPIYIGPPPPIAPAAIQQAIPPQGSSHRPPRPMTVVPQQPSVPKTSPAQPGPPPPRPSAIISAAPQLRDFKKEATSFVPPALRKKQAAAKAQAAKGGLSSAVDAAPGADTGQGTASSRVDLLDTLRPHLTNQAQDCAIPGASAAASSAPPSSMAPQKSKQAGEDDYKRFLGEIGDLL